MSKKSDFSILLLLAVIVYLIFECNDTSSRDEHTATPFDSAFGGTGIIATNIGAFSDFGTSVAIQEDGKIVVAGSTENDSDSDSEIESDFALVRYNMDGSLDSTFGAGGIVTTDIELMSESATSIAIQPDGKIIIAGSSGDYPNIDFALARYDTDGTPDSTFGIDGIVTTSIGASFDYVCSIAIQSDGRIIAAGNTYNNPFTCFALVRYNTDGSLDSTFGTGGIVTTDIGSKDEALFSVTIQIDGRIIAVGNTTKDIINGEEEDFALVRYNTDGSLDSTFGTLGIVTTDIIGWSAEARSVVLQPDGKIIATGNSHQNTSDDFVVARYNIDGSLDATFGSDGIIITGNETWSEVASSIAIQPDGKIIIAGSTSRNLDIYFALARYSADGSLDTSFGTGGIMTTERVLRGIANSVALQTDGKIIAVGYTYYYSGNIPYTHDIAVIRCQP